MADTLAAGPGSLAAGEATGHPCSAGIQGNLAGTLGAGLTVLARSLPFSYFEEACGAFSILLTSHLY